jgi:hypothetical protein
MRRARIDVIPYPPPKLFSFNFLIFQNSMTKYWEKLHNEEHCNLYPSFNIVKGKGKAIPVTDHEGP